MTPLEFKLMRKAGKLTQAEMGRRLGVSRKTVVNWEADTFQLPVDIADQIAKAGLVSSANVALAPAKASYQMDSASRYARDVEGYHRLRTEWRYPNHATVMEYKRMEGFSWAPEAFPIIAQRYPDVLTAPGQIDWNALMPTIDYLWRNPNFGGFRGPLLAAHVAKYGEHAAPKYPDGFAIIDNQLCLLTEKKGN